MESKTMTNPLAPSAAAGATKLCQLMKRPDFDGYGFNLHSEKSKPGQFIGKVDAHSPAEEAGLREGERIVEVNGVPIGSEPHRQVVQRIKALGGEVRLLLIALAENDASTGECSMLKADTKVDIGNKSNNNIDNRDLGTTTATRPSNTGGGALVATASTTNNTLTEGRIQMNNKNNGDVLQLPLTAAEMRAKLMAKKKYDPKNEMVDLKKKFEIIQKL